MKKLKVEFIPTKGYYDEYDRIEYMHLTCILYKLGVIEHPVYPGQYRQSFITKLAEDMLAGHRHVYER